MLVANAAGWSWTCGVGEAEHSVSRGVQVSSRARSSSNAWRPRWLRYPSVSTTRRSSGARGSRRVYGPTAGVDLGHRKAGVAGQRSRNARSNSLRVPSVSISPSESPRYSAWRVALRTMPGDSTWRRSARVRVGVVTAMRSRMVLTLGIRWRERWMRSPSRLRRPASLGTVTSTGARRRGRSRQSSAALRWLRTAPSPHANTAAIHLPLPLSPAMPDGVYAAEDPVEPSRLDRFPDAVLADPGGTQLPDLTTPC